MTSCRTAASIDGFTRCALGFPGWFLPDDGGVARIEDFRQWTIRSQKTHESLQRSPMPDVIIIPWLANRDDSFGMSATVGKSPVGLPA